MNASSPKLVVLRPQTGEPATRALDSSRAFRRTLDLHLPSLYRTARALTKNDAAAQDLVQDSVLTAWRALGTLEAAGAVRAWLHRILHRTFLNSRREAGRRPQVAEVDLDELIRAGGLDDEPLWEPVEDDLDDALARELEALPTGFREVVWLVDVEGLTLAEAAAALEIPVGTAASRRYRAHRQLRERLSGGVRAGRR